MKLNYFDLISPTPIRIPDIGGLISPKLRDIASIGYNTYQFYLSIILLDVSSYLKLIGQSNLMDHLSCDKKNDLHVFDLLIANKESSFMLQDIFNFFIEENVIYLPDKHYFIVKDNQTEEIVGKITRENYNTVCDLICQCNNIKSTQKDDISKVKSKKAQEIMKKLQKGRSEKKMYSKTDENLELGNIISSVSSKSSSLNIINIWDLTVFQLWDCFTRLSNNVIYDIQSMSVAAWGNKDNYFDSTSWFKQINDFS